MPLEVAYTGCRFEGYCGRCKAQVQGRLVDEGSPDFICIDNKRVARIGTKGYGDCGHDTTVVTGSDYVSIEGIPVARRGDSVIGTINGYIIEGSDFVLI